MNEYDLDNDETWHNDIKEMKIIIKKIGNGFLMNNGTGYNFYFKIEDCIKHLDTLIPKLWK